MNQSEEKKATIKKINVQNVHSNVEPEILAITLDKLKIVLLENERRIVSAQEWQTPITLLCTIILVFCTADFTKSFFAIKAEVWEAIFIVAAILSFFWLVVAFYRCAHRMSADELIDCMKRREQ